MGRWRWCHRCGIFVGVDGWMYICTHVYIDLQQRLRCPQQAYRAQTHSGLDLYRLKDDLGRASAAVADSSVSREDAVGGGWSYWVLFAEMKCVGSSTGTSDGGVTAHAAGLVVIGRGSVRVTLGNRGLVQLRERIEQTTRRSCGPVRARKLREHGRKGEGREGACSRGISTD